MEHKNEHHGNSFIWGLLIGAIFATLLTTTKGRRILKDLTDLGLELFEDFIEEKTRETETVKTREDIEESEEGLLSRTEEAQAEKMESSEGEREIIEEKEKEVKPNGNGHKKRLFRGIRRK